MRNTQLTLPIKLYRFSHLCRGGGGGGGVGGWWGGPIDGTKQVTRSKPHEDPLLAICATSKFLPCEISQVGNKNARNAFPVRGEWASSA